MQRGPARSSRMAKASRPPTMVARAVPRAAPGTPSPAPQTVMPHSVRVGLMRKKLKMASSTQAGGQGVACCPEDGEVHAHGHGEGQRR